MTLSPVAANTGAPVNTAAPAAAGRPGQATITPATTPAVAHQGAASVWERQTFSALLESAAQIPDLGEAPVIVPQASGNLPGQPASQNLAATPLASAASAQAGEAALTALAQSAVEAALSMKELPLAAAPAIALRVGGALAGTTLWLSRRGDGWGISVADARREQRQLLSAGEQELAAHFSRAGLGSLQLEFTE